MDCGCCGPPCPGTLCLSCRVFRPLPGFEEIYAADTALKAADARLRRQPDQNTEDLAAALRNYHDAWSRAPDYEPVKPRHD